MFTHTFQDTIYGRRVELCVGTAQEFNAHMKVIGSKERVATDDLGGMRTVMLPSKTHPQLKAKTFFIWLIAFNGSPDAIGTLVHECYHATAAIMDHQGVAEEDEGSEARAYYLNALVVQFLTALEGRKNETASS